ncbi:MAG: RNA polymerase sigma factor [Myxococcales bacterium]|nr:RNA polymerase sigma factor [Myxococcales bacterium]MCB9641891.1 RNA polymerase sigma factor [Myxococcales bacterium]
MSIGTLTLALKTNETTDEDLMLDYAQGDAQAFQHLYERHRKPVFNFILRSVHSMELAEELMQDVFMRVIQNAQSYTKQAKFTTWLYTIARNICIDSYRRQKHRVMLSLHQSGKGRAEEEGPTLEQSLEDAEARERSEDKAFFREVHQSLEIGLDGLPPEQREVFLLREVSNLSYKEIADVVGTLENTVKSRMRYALEHLRRHLESRGVTLEDLQR